MGLRTIADAGDNAYISEDDEGNRWLTCRKIDTNSYQYRRALEMGVQGVIHRVDGAFHVALIEDLSRWFVFDKIPTRAELLTSLGEAPRQAGRFRSSPHA